MKNIIIKFTNLITNDIDYTKTSVGYGKDNYYYTYDSKIENAAKFDKLDADIVYYTLKKLWILGK